MDYDLQKVQPDFELLKERNVRIKELEQEMSDLHEMQIEFAKLVQQQGEQLSHIEDLVVVTNTEVKEANHELATATQLQNKHRWIKNGILLGATGILLATTPVIAVGSKVIGPLAVAAYTYPKVSIPIGAMMAIKYAT